MPPGHPHVKAESTCPGPLDTIRTACPAPCPQTLCIRTRRIKDKNKTIETVRIMTLLLVIAICTPLAGAWAGEDRPLIVAIENVGDNAHETVEFTLNECTALRIHAVGEGFRTGMKDFGSIENAATGQVIWQMYYFETEQAGRSISNRRVDRRISLPAGTYRLHFQTNDSHSFENWKQTPPDPLFWGIALYRESTPRPPACWERAGDPEALGWSPEKLKEIIPRLEEMNCAALMVITDGQVVFEWGNTAVNFFAHSMRKSLLSALYGIYVAEGQIDLTRTLAELGIDDKVPLTDEEKQATVADLLKARSGVYIPAAGEAASMKAARPERGSHAPGTFWYYNNWDFNTLGTIFDQETGEKNIYKAFETRIAGPIGMQDFIPEMLRYTYAPHSIHPYYGFRISARDLARFGQLFLQEGAWQDAQIVPAAWVQESTTPHSLTGSPGTYSGYGYMWWIAAKNYRSIQKGSFAASGYGGHTLEVLPHLDTVIVFRINTDNPNVPLAGGHQVDQLVSAILQANRHARDPLVIAGRLSQGWLILTAGALALLAWDLVREKRATWRTELAWMLIVAVFGLLGLLAYRLSYRQPGGASWRRALGATAYSVTGNTIGLLLLLAFYYVFLPNGNTGPLVLLAPFLVGWLAFRAPLLAEQSEQGYWHALRRALLTEIISTCLVLAGMFPVLYLGVIYWMGGRNDLAHPLWWGLVALAAGAGLLLVYPFNLWLAHRGWARWPAPEGAAFKAAPSLRSAWPALLLSFALLIASLGLTMGNLN